MALKRSAVRLRYTPLFPIRADSRISGNNVLYDVPVHIGQPEATALKLVG